MSGRGVTVALILGVVVLASISWGIGLRVKAAVDAEAERQGVPRLSREEAAERVAREDMFGLPSRLPNAPEPEMSVARRIGTPAQPLSPDAAGLQQLFRAYEVSVKGCTPQLPEAEAEAEELRVLITLANQGDHARVVAIDGPGEGTRTQAFTACLRGGVSEALFLPAEQPQLTLPHRLALP